MSKLVKTIALAVLAGAIARGLRGKYNRNSHSGHGVQKSRYGIDANELVDFVKGTRATFETLNGSPRLKPGDFNLKQHSTPRKEAPNV